MKLQQIKMLAYGLILVFPILLVLDVMGYEWMRRTESALEAKARAGDVLLAEERTAAALTLAEFAGREALAAKSTAALGFYRTARAGAFAGLENLKPFAESNPAVAKSLPLLGALFAQEFAAVDQRIESPAQGQFAARDPELEAKLFDLGEKSRKQLEGIRASEESVLASSQEEANASSKRAATILEGADALALWSVALAALLVFRDTQRRTWAGAERRMQSRALEALPLAVLVTDDHGIVLYSNASAQALFGYRGDNLLGRHVSLVEGERNRSEDRHRAIDEQLAASGTWTGESQGRQSNGTTFRCSLRVASGDVLGKRFQLYLYDRIPESPVA
jgi:PAS domain S-box-containing protein